jgi:hypothetical protein
MKKVIKQSNSRRDATRHKYKKTSQGSSNNTKKSFGKKYRGQGK